MLNPFVRTIFTCLKFLVMKSVIYFFLLMETKLAFYLGSVYFYIVTVIGTIVVLNSVLLFEITVVLIGVTYFWSILGISGFKMRVYLGWLTKSTFWRFIGASTTGKEGIFSGCLGM